jgi:hypothetical protein
MKDLITKMFLLRRKIECFIDYTCKSKSAKETLEEWVTELLRIENDMKRLTDAFNFLNGTEESK